MREVDQNYYLNASEICSAAGLPRAARARYFRKIRHKLNFARRIWILLTDGYFLAEAVGLEEIKPLFSYVDKPRLAGENYLTHPRSRVDKAPKDFETMEREGISITYTPTGQAFNATQFLKSYGVIKQALREYLTKKPSATIKRNNGNVKLMGTWMRIENGSRLCRNFRLSEGVIDKIRERCKESLEDEDSNEEGSEDIESDGYGQDRDNDANGERNEGGNDSFMPAPQEGGSPALFDELN